MAKQSKFGALLKQAQGKFDVAGVPVGDIVSTVASVFKRKPNVRPVSYTHLTLPTSVPV